MKTLAFVFARGGSKGIPRKNLQLLGGKPLLAWSIEMGQSLSEVERVFVSTEDQEIAEVAISFGAEVISRPAELAQDMSPEWLAWQHAIKFVEAKHGRFERFLSLPATAPLRNQQDVQRCLDKLDAETDGVITMTPASRSPWFNMVLQESTGELRLLVEGNYVRRQDAPSGFDLSTLAYVLRPDFVLKNSRYWDGRVRGIEVPNERALDIDTFFDLEIARFLHQKANTNV
jgi:N-acylneuraminate cytidylyltransferase